MKPLLFGLLAETHIHAGSGSNAGIVDLPVAREAATDYPFVPGSSLKGALRDRCERNAPNLCNGLFGSSDKAGDLLVSDARLLLLPVRSLSGSYCWATCPLIIERLARDLLRAGRQHGRCVPSVDGSAGDVAAALKNGSDASPLYLEERTFQITGRIPPDAIETIGLLIRHEATRKRLEQQLVIISNDDFAWFARYALPVQARNQLDGETKASKNLWYEESLPPDTLLYALVASRADLTEPVEDVLFPPDDPYLQLGGNETVGQGWVAVALATEPR